MRAVYKMYEVEITRDGFRSVSIKAKNRFGYVFNILIERYENSWIGYSDFGSTKRTLKGIIQEFYNKLTYEVRDYDLRFYKLNCYHTSINGSESLPMTWEQTEYKKIPDNTPEPTFKGGVKFNSLLTQ